MNFSNKENQCHIVEGQEIWYSRSVAVAGMVLMLHDNEQYVLLGKRGKGLPNAVGQWCMPCGYLDWDETCEDAMIREVWEETGLNLREAMNSYDVIYDHTHYPWRINSDPDSPLQNVSMHYAVYMKTVPDLHNLSKLPNITFVNNEDINEVDAVEWVKISDLNTYDCAFGHDTIIRVFINSILK